MIQAEVRAVGDFFFSRAQLAPIADAERHGFLTADPFRHTVIDGLLPDEVLDQVLEEFPERGDVQWKEFHQTTSVKLATTSDEQLGPRTRSLLQQFNSAPFVEFLELLTGIDGLIPDPHYEGGGLHRIEPGGYLKVHADFNRYERLRLDRRLNVLVYLNRDWEESYGGALELWDADMTECRRRVLPTFNRMVIFATTDQSFHGHPDPLTCPEGRARRSLALYYYTAGRPAEERSPAHNTLYQARPGEQIDRSRMRRLAGKVVGR